MQETTAEQPLTVLQESRKSIAWHATMTLLPFVCCCVCVALVLLHMRPLMPGLVIIPAIFGVPVYMEISAPFCRIEVYDTYCRLCPWRGVLKRRIKTIDYSAVEEVRARWNSRYNGDNYALIFRMKTGTGKKKKIAVHHTFSRAKLKDFLALLESKGIPVVIR